MTASALRVTDLGEASASDVSQHEFVRARLLFLCEALARGAVVVFMAGWVAAFLIHPLPRWLLPTMVTAFGVAAGAILLYNVATLSFTEPIENTHWELETPTTVRNLVRQNRVGPLFLWIVFSVVAIAVVRDQLRLSTVTAVPLGLLIGAALSWVFVFLYARGWIRDE